jgi:hypothetical protein
MGKAPAFQFYPGDWRRDTQVQMARMETRGVWFEMLCCMWDAPERGKLTGGKLEIARLLGCDVEVLQRALNEIEKLKIADVTNGNNEVTIINRRMKREQKQRESTRLRVKRHRSNKTSNAKVTPPSSSSSSSSPSRINKLEDLKSKYPWLNLELWKEFRKYRTRIKAPLTNHAEMLCLADLTKIVEDGFDQDESINQTLKSGKWKSFYEPKNKPKKDLKAWRK